MQLECLRVRIDETTQDSQKVHHNEHPEKARPILGIGLSHVLPLDHSRNDG